MLDMPVASVAEIGVSAGVTAIATILAAALGAYVTLNAQQRQEEARAKRAAAAAWNLITVELGDALATVYETQEEGKWPIGRHRTWVKTWEESKQALLEYPRAPGVLDYVVAASARLDMLESAVNAGRSEEERDLSERDQHFLADTQELLEEAYMALGQVPEGRRPRRGEQTEA